MIEITDICKTYQMGHVEVRALQGVSLRIERGEFVAIVGPSGSGKSTLMHILGLLDTPDRGNYRLDGREVSDLSEDELADQRARSIGFVFQQFNLLARVSACENVALPLIYGDHASPVSPEALLARVGLGDRMGHAPNELSGGQQQRVAIARALVNAPPILMADEPTGNLDSQSSADILRILRELHASGLTVILVTHDPTMAQEADRTITMLDGKVVEDTGRADITEKKDATLSDTDMAVSTAGTRVSPLARKLREGVAMFRQAGRSLTANKTRTLLSMLGVLIGVAAVIAVMAIGAGAKQAVSERIASMGANLLTLRPPRRRSGGVSLGAGAVSRLTVEDALAIPQSLNGVQYVTPIVRGAAQVTATGANWRTSVTGVLPVYVKMHNMTPPVGRCFNDTEVEARARVAVIGLTVSETLFGNANPIGKTIRVNRVAFEVIGLLPQKASSFHRDENDQILVPITTAMYRLLGEKYVNEIEIQAASADDLDYLEMASAELMKTRHRIASTEDSPFEVRNMADFQSTISSTSDTMSALLLGIGAISLLVGGIGIMNIMLVSVTERTREIGIRKAVGARRADILMQFLIESVVVSASGGLLGILLGGGLSLAMGRISGWTVVIQPLTLLVAFSFSALVGIVFGLWPARKAAALAPIKALRYE